MHSNGAEELVLYNSNSCSNTVSELLFQHPYDAITIPLVIKEFSYCFWIPASLNPIGSKHGWQILVWWISYFLGEVLKAHSACCSYCAIWACQGVSVLMSPFQWHWERLNPVLKQASVKWWALLFSEEEHNCLSFLPSLEREEMENYYKRTAEIYIEVQSRKTLSKCNIQFSGVGTFPCYEYYFSF